MAGIASRPRTLAVLCLAFVLAPASARAADGEKLVRATFNQLTDQLGTTYYFDNNGRIRTQLGYIHAGIQINNGGFGSSQPMMTPDAREFVLQGQVNNVELMRRFRVDTKVGGVRCTEVLTNRTGAAVPISLLLHTQIGYPARMVTTDSGRPAGTGMLGPKDCGLVAHLQGPVQGVALFTLASSKSKLKPNIVNNNNQNFQFVYNFSLPPKKRVAIMHTITIRSQAAAPNAKTLATWFRPSLSRKWRQNLPKDLRRSVLNMRGGAAFGPTGEGALPDMEAQLEIGAGSLDSLAFGEETLVQGTASCRSLSVEGAFGAIDIPFDRVAAIVGAEHPRLAPQVFLRDRQRLVGRIAADGLRFEMTSGIPVDLEIERLDRLVMRADPDAESVPLEDGSFLVETLDGNRLTLLGPGASLRAATQWGARALLLENLLRIQPQAEDQPGHWLQLEDGSRFRAYLSGGTLRAESSMFGTVEIAPHEIRSLVAASTLRRRGEEREDEEEVLRSHVVLAGGDLVVGRLKLDALHFVGNGQVIPVPPSQIKLLQNVLEGELPEPGQNIRFQAEIWGGGRVAGELREVILPFETGSGTLSLPVRDIVQVHVPTPIVPDTLRARVGVLIRDLGHPDWERREAAGRELLELGALARSSLQEALRQTKDPEIARRVRRLLDELED